MSENLSTVTGANFQRSFAIDSPAHASKYSFLPPEVSTRRTSELESTGEKFHTLFYSLAQYLERTKFRQCASFM